MNTSLEKMSAVDKAWLHMDSPANLMMITTVLIFESPIDIIQLRKTLQERFLHFKRFRQRVIQQNGETYWQDDPYFDLDHHLIQVGLPGKGDQKSLQQLTSDLSNIALDPNRPLWQFHLIDNFQGGSALIARIHHCIADGISLVRVLLSITDDTPLEEESTSGLIKEAEHWLSPARKLFQQAMQLGHEVIEEGIDLWQHPEHLMDLAQKGLSIGAELSSIGLMAPDPATCLKNKLSGRKQLAWAPSFPLDQVKRTAHALSGTINDVLISSATGALHQYLSEEKTLKNDDELRLVVPVNLRPLDQPINILGNQFGLVLVSLPVGEEDCEKRYIKVKNNMEKLKSSPQAQVFYGMLGALGKGPSKLEQTALEVLSKNASAVMTNVPGPRKTLYLAGSKLIQPMVWVPQSGEVGVGLSILSYDNSIQFGLIADKAMIPQPDIVVDLFQQSYQELAKFAG